MSNENEIIETDSSDALLYVISGLAIVGAFVITYKVGQAVNTVRQTWKAKKAAKEAAEMLDTDDNTIAVVA